MGGQIVDKIEIGLKKKSFSMFFNGGEIWFEHLDSLHDQTELIKQKFTQDLLEIQRPSTSSFIAVILNESNINGEILDLIINEFLNLNKQLRKVVFIGLTMKMKRYVKKRSTHTNFLIICMDDLEKAKEWLVKN